MIIFCFSAKIFTTLQVLGFLYDFAVRNTAKVVFFFSLRLLIFSRVTMKNYFITFLEILTISEFHTVYFYQ